MNFPGRTNQNSFITDYAELPSIVSKFSRVESCGASDDADTDSEQDQEEQIRDMTMLDMVVHIDEIQSQLTSMQAMYSSFVKLNEMWHDRSSDYIDDCYRVKWIVDETKKRKALNAMNNSIQQLQDELAMLSIKSKDMYREHRQHLELDKQKAEAKKIRREKQRKSLQHQEQQRLHQLLKIKPVATATTSRRSQSMGTSASVRKPTVSPSSIL